MATNLVAQTTKSEVDTNLQTLSRMIVDVREQIELLHAWRAPHEPQYLLDLGYTTEQESELSAFLNVSKMWSDLIGAGGTISAPNGVMFEDLLTAVYGLGGNAGIVTEPPPPAE
jgi:hypothetical protein